MDKAGKSAIRRIIRVFVVILTISLIFTLGIFVFLTREGVSFVAVNGNSMNPTFEDRDTLVLIQADKIEKEQIAIVKKPKKWSDYKLNSRIIKRISGVPGDVFSYDGETIKINDETIVNIEEDNYDCEAGEKGFTKTLETNEYLITGDNINESLDSIRIFCDGNSKSMTIKNKNIVNNGEVRFIL